ncbi:heterokaryon incompatibility protein-domain-containing protein [Immersiella caudata]|uniref:Heterokaryon incompatibility protein-domain-containing protein n=1 Tax=Immersiella caudata TaxID=314043 RepID=A0AA40C6T2_9PEZI|nr:heterokaryon incompatibility protein-domain-containing protein [Immersiella caudata]
MSTRCPMMLRLRAQAEFFLPIYDSTSGFNHHGPSVPLPSFTILKACAEAGCELCTIFCASAKPVFGSQELWLYEGVRLRRALLDPHQSVQLFIGMDDFSRTFFYRIPKPWRQLPRATLDRRNEELDLMRLWLERCRAGHKECQASIQSTVFPTRLLDTQPFKDSDDVRLLDVRKEGLASCGLEWVALSHCWGLPSQGPTTTMTTNLAQRRLRIPFPNLSRTFQDAVKITRELNYRYLWIDSLCIIQDDHDDWAREAGIMGGVYNGSVCTLCALSSENSTQGCRINGMGTSTHENMPRYADFDIGDTRIRFFEREPTYWHQECGDDPYKFEGFKRHARNPLNTRAWTLQERELSCRKILFSQNLLLWECRTMKGSSELPWHQRMFDTDERPHPVLLNADETVVGDGSTSMRDRWYSLVEDYSSRFLTKETDKLIAIAGLRNAIKTGLSGFREEDYVAGMFSQHMPGCLLWQSWPYGTHSNNEQAASMLNAFQPRRPMVYRAPSWSWASIDGEVSHQSQRLSQPASSAVGPLVSDWSLSKTGPGGTHRATLNLRGRPVPARFQYRRASLLSRTVDRHVPGSWEEDTRLLLSEDGKTVGAFFPDIITEVQLLDRVICLAIQSEQFGSVLGEPNDLHKDDSHEEEDFSSRSLAMGLALVKNEDSDKNTFRRVGLIRWVKPDIFFGVEEQVVVVL